jgi:hypothetical protein
VLGFAAFALVVLAVVVPAGMWQFRGYDLLPDTPIPDSPVAHVFVAIEAAGVAAAVTGILIGLWSLVSRARRTRGDLRQQLAWFAFGAGVAVVANLTALATGLSLLVPVGVLAVLLGIGLGIFRYRLYDVDRLSTVRSSTVSSRSPRSPPTPPSPSCSAPSWVDGPRWWRRSVRSPWRWRCVRCGT